MHSNSFEFLEGSAASPALQVFGRPGTGIYFESASNSFVFVVNAVEIGRFGAGGLIQGINLAPRIQPTVDTTAGVITYTAAMLKGGLIARDPNGAARLDVTDTAANIIAAFGMIPGEAIQCLVQNNADAAETITVTAGAGVTVVGIATITQNQRACLVFFATSPTALNCYVV